MHETRPAIAARLRETEAKHDDDCEWMQRARMSISPQALSPSLGDLISLAHLEGLSVSDWRHGERGTLKLSMFVRSLSLPVVVPLSFLPPRSLVGWAPRTPLQRSFLQTNIAI